MNRAIVSISGLVQGIGFRPFVYRLAVNRDLKGYVKNLGDAGVDIEVTGREEDIRAFLVDLKEKKPAIAIYTKVDVKWLDEPISYNEFVIDNSDLGRREVKLSIIPPDITICPDCLAELFDSGDRHHLYPFTCCALCGPRLTTIVDLPYDRERTTMDQFPLCPECGREFNDPMERRFNAQTICCPVCGPHMTLHGPDGHRIEEGDPLKAAAELLSEGAILAIKGIGGTHLAVKTTEDDHILLMRKKRRKPGKPFAIMSPSLEEVESYAIITEVERKLLTSYARPIVALRKRETFPLSSHISPGLHTVGVMLPYSGIHHVLFSYLKEPALVMTSANLPGEPMAITNEDACKRLEGIADYFLLHDREIYARADDSVAKVVDGEPLFLRRSRGYVPMPLNLPFKTESTVAAVGPEEASTAAVLKGDKCYLTQHLGDIESPEAVSFLKEALGHIIKLTRAGTPDAIALDMHPNFLSRNVAHDLAEESGGRLVEVQHHHAHLASVMADAGINEEEEIVGIMCDGYGYGLDGAPWGGEILVGGYGNFRRAGHLEPQPMPGGDLSALRYGRMLQGVLHDEISKKSLRSLLLERCREGFVGGEKEVDIVFEQIEKNINTPMTTSTGRLLDAVSCLLGVSYRRTYEGEGAIKLEAAAASGGDNSMELPIEIEIRNGARMLQTSGILRTLLDNLGEYGRRDLAYAFHIALARGLAEMAIDVAGEAGIETVGFGGGVANNDLITRTIRENVVAQGLRFLRHTRVPAGDGGLSLGQAVVAYARLL